MKSSTTNKIVCTVAALASLAVVSVSTGQERRLLLDDRIVEEVDNGVLRLGQIEKHPANPLFGEEHEWEPRFDNMYPNVLYDEEEQIYKVWYFTWTYDPATSDVPRAERRPGEGHGLESTYMKIREASGKGLKDGLGYATSKDGLRWEKPMMNISPWNGKPSNLVAQPCHGAGILKDLREPDPARRYKMILKGQGIAARFSPDGLHWGEWFTFPEMDAPGDTHNNALWSPELNKYVCFTRLRADGVRIVGRSESPDFIHWTKAVEVLRGDDGSHETYSMPVIRYAGVYLGMVAFYRDQLDRMDTRLAWSPDTIHWQRIEPDKPLIPNGDKKGDYDWGIAHASFPIIREKEIRIYYGACNGPHFDWRDGFLSLATLRPDGFAGYEPQDAARPAVVVTKPVTLGAELKITADAQGGSISVAIVDETGKVMLTGNPITANVTDMPVSWSDSSALEKLAGQKVRLRFEIRRAKLYSFVL